MVSLGGKLTWGAYFGDFTRPEGRRSGHLARVSTATSKELDWYLEEQATNSRMQQSRRRLTRNEKPRRPMRHLI
jgi:hypothetical protein